jgi:hypothetical protein
MVRRQAQQKILPETYDLVFEAFRVRSNY